MLLHHNKEKFKYYVKLCSTYFNISENEVIKEYFMMNYLTELFKNPNYVLKGSAALKLCYNCINRKVNDIDLISTNGKLEKDFFINEEINNHNINWIETNDKRHAQAHYEYTVDNITDFFNIDYVSIDKYEEYSYLPCCSSLQKYLEKYDSKILKEYDMEISNFKVARLEDIFVGKIFAASNKFVSPSNREKESLKHIRDAYNIFKLNKFDDDAIFDTIKKTIKKDANFLPADRVEEIFKFNVLKDFKNNKVGKLLDLSEALELNDFLERIYYKFFIYFKKVSDICN